ncbi:MAG: stage 0 sporulation family protein [Dehalococcoidia bacterium]|nr:MAG: stage 0 sporulation family protein [Dehalococcoidia bacterium]
MAEIVGIRFKRAGRVYYFDPAGIELEVNDCVVVKTTRGLELGYVVISPAQVLDSAVTGPLKPVMRKAKPDDIKRAHEFESKNRQALAKCGELIAKLQLPMKLLSAEYDLSGKRLTFFFSAVERVDFRELVRELTNHFKVRVELRQVGPRDEAKLIGGFGRCGRPLCCMSFLSEFAPVSIKMAKEQDLPLNPMKISGICGRLMCCLGYEGELYQVMRERLPKEGQQVSTPMGVASVVGGNPLKETVLVELESGATVELPLSEITIEAERPHQQGKEG